MINNYDELPLVLNVEQLSTVLEIGINSAYQLVRSGRVPNLRIGRQYRIPKSAVINLLDGVAVGNAQNT